MFILNPSEVDNIEQKAKDILLSVYPDGEMEPPIDLSKILEQYGISLSEGSFEDSNVAGQYNKADKSILVSDGDIYQRKIFTVAHELGHFFLHDDKDEETFYRTQLTQLDTEKKKIEAEANWFAASLLMPKDIVFKYWGLVDDIDVIAKLFGVSHSAAFFRLKNLGLI